jgi:hypothetical protein
MMEEATPAAAAAPKCAMMEACAGSCASSPHLVGSYTPKNSAEAGNENRVAGEETKGK